MSNNNNNDERKSSSPYYKGLTDSSLALSSINNKDHSSNIIEKMIELSSCFSFKSNKKGHDPHRPSSFTSSAKPLRGRVSLEHERAARPTTLVLNETVLNENKDSDHDQNVDNKVLDDEVNVGYTWAEKYRPRSLSEFICNRDKAEYLKTLMKRGDCGHFIFKGPPGVGKRTMIWGMLGEAFGVDTQGKTIITSAEGQGGSIKVNNVKTCLEQVEVSVDDNLGYEKLVAFIKDAQTKLSRKALKNTKDNCIAIIIYEAEKMSEDALLYIRWLLERYKVFFCCSDDSKLQPVKSICTTVDLTPPPEAEIVEVLKFIADKESIELPIELATRIAGKSNNNLRQAIHSFEATSRFWLYIIRGQLQNLTNHNLSPEFICQLLVRELKKHLDEEHHYIVDDLFDEYYNGDKSSLVLTYNQTENMDPSNIICQCFSRMEEFIAKFMSIYKSSLLSKKREKDEKAS